MEIIWHPTNHIHTRVMEVRPPHKLGKWVVLHKPGGGLGVLTVEEGPLPNPPPEVMAMMRIKGVWRILVDPDGFFIVTIYLDREWARVEAELIQAYVIAKEAQEKTNAGA